jgi:hypothetical protein
MHKPRRSRICEWSYVLSVSSNWAECA